jgi:5'-nucleotidase
MGIIMSEHIDGDLWVQTRSGRAVDLLDTQPEQINAEDIAVQLGRIPRWNGATIGRPNEIYPVAMHSILVSMLLPHNAPPELRLVALLHDAHEAYTGDMPSPVKWAIRHILHRNGCSVDPFRYISDTVQDAVLRAVGIEHVPDTYSVAVKQADMLALALEDRYMMAPYPRPWVKLPDVSRVAMVPMTRSPGEASRAFLFNLRRYVNEAGLTAMPGFWAS